MLRRSLIPLALVLLPACANDPVASHRDLPMLLDTVVPALLDVGGASVEGLAWLAEDSVTYAGVDQGHHPTAVLLRNPWNGGWLQHIAHALRLQGWNAITFDYRGTWQSLGTFTLGSMRNDVEEVLIDVRAEWATSSWQVAADRITLIGHLWGGGVALAAAARDPGVRCVAALAPVNVGLMGRLAGQSTAYQDRLVVSTRAWVTTLNPGDIPNVRLATSPEQFVQEVIARADEFDIAMLAPRLAGRPVLLLGTTSQELDIDPALHLAPMREPLLQADALVTDTVMFGAAGVALQGGQLVATILAWLGRERCGG